MHRASQRTEKTSTQAPNQRECKDAHRASQPHRKEASNAKIRTVKRPRRPHKLNREEYVGRAAVFTLCISNRSIVFTDDVVYAAMLRCLKEAAAKHGCLFPAFCFMPDHAHILVMPAEDTSNTLDAINKFKLQSGIWLHNHGFPKWQYGSWDDMVGSSRSWKAHAKYILMNPVRANLVEEWGQYSYLGNLHGQVNDIFA